MNNRNALSHMVKRLMLILSVCALVACGNKSGSKGDEGDLNDRTLDPDKFEVKSGKFSAIGVLPQADDPSRLEGELVKPATCEDASNYIKSRMLTEIDRNFKQAVEYYDEYKRYRQPGAAEDGAVSADSADSAEPMAESANKSAAGDGAGGPDDYTTTNNQVAGVQEADFVKNTGTHIFVIRGNKIHIVKSWPAESMDSVSTLTLKDQPLSLLLKDNTLIAITRPVVKSTENLDQMAQPDMAYRYVQYDYNSTRLYKIDISNLAKPKIVDTKLFHGSLNTTRELNGSVRLILSSYIGYPEGVQSYPHWNKVQETDSKQDYINALNAIMEENIKILSETPLEKLISFNRWHYGNYKLENEDDKQKIVLDDCANLYIPTTPTSMGLTNVATYNIEAQEASQSMLMSYSNIIYASKKSLFLTTPYYFWWWRSTAMMEEDNAASSHSLDYNYLHKFDLLDEDKAAYLGSGRVEGQINDQFSMDEYDDKLRVAVTLTRMTGEGNQQQRETANKVVVMETKDQKLQKIGETKELAIGERIMSARFDGKRGVIVTFRQVDPLFSIDLADPSDPKVLGELKIPGFSTYMQFIGENTLLAIGKAATAEGRITGTKVSLFDISDMTDPKETATLDIGQDLDWAYSEAERNHKAFTYFPSKGLLGVPLSGYKRNVNSYSYSNYSSRLELVQVAEDSLSPKGSVTMQDIMDGSGIETHYYGYIYNVRRSIFADDYVYSISNAGIKAVHLDDLDTTVSGVTLPCGDYCNSWWTWWW